MPAPRIGVLALQGAVPEHLRALQQVGAEAVAVRWPQELEGLDGLIIPGGESTTIGDLMQYYGFFPAIRQFYRDGGCLYGTCAGMIMLATDILDGKPNQPRLGLLNMTVRRNGFGRQVDSCESPLLVPEFGEPAIQTIFIRAPYVEAAGPGVEVMARFEDKIVMVRGDRLLATAFHPELTDDRRVHRLFAEMCRKARWQRPEATNLQACD